MYKGELKGLGIPGLKKMIKGLERSRDITQKNLDLLLMSKNKVNGTSKKELKKHLRFCETSLNRAYEVLEESEEKEWRASLTKEREKAKSIVASYRSRKKK